jgi:hypothetical protein
MFWSFWSFSVSINGFNDGQQDYTFYESAAGVQMDCLATKTMKIIRGMPYGIVKFP